MGQSDDGIFLYATVSGGKAASETIDTLRSELTYGIYLGYESQNSRPPEDHAVEFVDYPFSKTGDGKDDATTYEEHLEIVKREQPRIAVAPDVEHDRDPQEVFDRADELAEHAETVVVVPKEIHPSEIPDRFRVGIPNANFGSDAPWYPHDYVDTNEVHILGGSPTTQLRLANSHIPVRSVDGASVFLGAANYDVWTWRGDHSEKSWIEAQDTDYYDRLAASLHNAFFALNGSSRAQAMPEGAEDIPEHQVPSTTLFDWDSSVWQPDESADEQNAEDRQAVEEIDADLGEPVTDGGNETMENDPSTPYDPTTEMDDRTTPADYIDSAFPERDDLDRYDPPEDDLKLSHKVTNLGGIGEATYRELNGVRKRKRKDPEGSDIIELEEGDPGSVNSREVEGPVQTIGDFVDRGYPLHHADLQYLPGGVRDLLSVEELDPADPHLLVGVHTGVTNGALYDYDGEHTAGLPSLMLDQANTERLAWSWSEHWHHEREGRKSSDDPYDVAPTSPVPNASALGVGKFVPEHILDPADFEDPDRVTDWGNPAEIGEVSIHSEQQGIVFGREDHHVKLKIETVEYINALFSSDYTETDASELVWTAGVNGRGREGKDGDIVAFDHPTAPVFVVIVTGVGQHYEPVIRPEDFDVNQSEEVEVLEDHQDEDSLSKEDTVDSPPREINGWSLHGSFARHNGAPVYTSPPWVLQTIQESASYWSVWLRSDDRLGGSEIIDPDDLDSMDVVEEFAKGQLTERQAFEEAVEWLNEHPAEDMEGHGDEDTANDLPTPDDLPGDWWVSNQTEHRLEFMRETGDTTTEGTPLTERLSIEQANRQEFSRAAVVYLGPKDDQTHRLRAHQTVATGDTYEEVYEEAMEWLEERVSENTDDNESEIEAPELATVPTPDHTDSDTVVTALTGIGDTTGDKLADLGIETPGELKIAYLTDQGAEIEKAVHQGASTLVPALRTVDVPLSEYDELDAEWKVELMRWVRLSGGISALDKSHPDSRSVKGEYSRILPDMVDFSTEAFTNAANTVAFSHDNSETAVIGRKEDLEQAAGVLKADSSRLPEGNELYTTPRYSVFYTDDGHYHLVLGEYMEDIETFYGFDPHEHPERVLVHGDRNEFPIVVGDTHGHLSVAPRELTSEGGNDEIEEEVKNRVGTVISVQVDTDDSDEDESSEDGDGKAAGEGMEDPRIVGPVKIHDLPEQIGPYRGENRSNGAIYLGGPDETRFRITKALGDSDAILVQFGDSDEQRQKISEFDHTPGTTWKSILNDAVEQAREYAAEAGGSAASDPYDPLEEGEEWGPTMDRPISDFERDLRNPRRQALIAEDDYHVGSERYRVDEEEGKDDLALAMGIDDGERLFRDEAREPDTSVIEALENQGEVYDPTQEIEENMEAAEEAGVLDPDDAGSALDAGDAPEQVGDWGKGQDITSRLNYSGDFGELREHTSEHGVTNKASAVTAKMTKTLSGYQVTTTEGMRAWEIGLYDDRDEAAAALVEFVQNHTPDEAYELAVSDENNREREEEEPEDTRDDDTVLVQDAGVGRSKADDLLTVHGSSLDVLADRAIREPEEISGISGIGKITREKIEDWAAEYVDEQHPGKDTTTMEGVGSVHLPENATDNDGADELTDIKGIGEKTAEKLTENGIGTPEELGEAWAERARWAGYAKPVLSTLPDDHREHIGDVAAETADNLGLERDESGPTQMVDSDGNPLSDRVDESDDALDAEELAGIIGVREQQAESLAAEFDSIEALKEAAFEPGKNLREIDGVGKTTEERVETWAEVETGQEGAELVEKAHEVGVDESLIQGSHTSRQQLREAIEEAQEDESAVESEGGEIYDPSGEFDGEADSTDESADSTETVVLVGCGKSKRDGTHEARNLYDSTYFELKRDYAEAVGDEWFVLSAEHGLVRPTEEIEDYETGIGERDPDEWADDVLGELDAEGATVVVLAGSDYYEPLEHGLEAEVGKVEAPTMGLQIGKRMSWLSDHTPEADESDEPDTDDEESDTPTPKHFGSYRREKVERLEQTPRLEPVESFDSVDEMAEAIEEIHVPDYSTPPEKTIDKLRHNFGKLPNDEAERYYLNDYKLGRTINAARRAFNEWVGRKKRYDQMPGWAEAGPANYPKKKHKRRRDSAHKGREKLDEKLDRLNGRAKGAFRRALKKAGFSEAELNEQKRQGEREEMRSDLYPGAIVFYRDVIHGPNLWGVKRLNKKSARLKRPDGGDGYDLTTVDYDNSRLQHVPRGEIEEFDREELPDELTAGYDSAIRYLMGEEWVSDNLDSDQAGADPYADADQLDADEREAIEEAARDGELKGVLSAVGISASGPFWSKDWSTAGIETPADLVDHYEDHGDFERVRGIGPSKSEDLEAALPIVRDALGDESDGTPEVANRVDKDRGDQGPADEGRSVEASRHSTPPKEVNGWQKADTPTIEYQNPENTALAHVEGTGDNQFRPQIQGDETGTERLPLEDKRSEATEALVEWMETHDPEGHGLKDDEPTGEHEHPTYECEECGDVVEDSPMPMDRCIYCGGDMEMTDAGTGPTDESTPTIFKAERNRWPLLEPYEHSTTTVSDLAGIGNTTEKKVGERVGAIEVPAFAGMTDADLRQIGDALPSEDAVDTLIEAVEQAAEKHNLSLGDAQQIRDGYEGDDGTPEVGNQVEIRWRDDSLDYDDTGGSEIWGVVTDADGDTLTIEVNQDNPEYTVVDLSEDRVRQKNGNHQTQSEGDLVAVKVTHEEAVLTDRATPDDADGHDTHLSELDGIGEKTQQKIERLVGLLTVAHARTAYERRAEYTDWKELLDMMPSSKARESLVEAVGADPEGTVAEEVYGEEHTLADVPEAPDGWEQVPRIEDNRIVWRGPDTHPTRDGWQEYVEMRKDTHGWEVVETYHDDPDELSLQDPWDKIETRVSRQKAVDTALATMRERNADDTNDATEVEDWDAPDELTDIKGLGPQTAAQLREAGVETPMDLGKAFAERGRWQGEIAPILDDLPSHFNTKVGGMAAQIAERKIGEHAVDDAEVAAQMHSRRSPEAQAQDESIQAREQTTEIEVWATARNYVDFVGVDDLATSLGIEPGELADAAPDEGQIRASTTDDDGGFAIPAADGGTYDPVAEFEEGDN